MYNHNKLEIIKQNRNDLINPKYLLDFNQYKIDWDILTPEFFVEVFEHLLPLVKQDLILYKQKSFNDLIFNDFIEDTAAISLATKYLSLFNFYNVVNRNEELTKNLIKYNQEFNNLFLDLSFDKDLFDKTIKFKELYYTEMSDEQKQLIDKSIENFINNGVNLSKEQQQQLKIIQNDLSIFKDNFSNNNIKTEEQTFLFISTKELQTLNQELQNEIKGQPLINGEYQIYYNTGLISQILTDSNDTNVRKKAFNAINQIGLFNEYDNYVAAQNIVKKYYELADLLGYDTPAKMFLKNNMIKDPKEIISFSNKILSLSQEQYEKDFYLFLEKSKEILGHEVNIWDINFIFKQLNKQLFNLEQTEIKKYFPIKQVLNGFIDIFGQLYDIQFSYSHDKAWNDDVYTIELKDKKTEQFIGKIYLDMFMRNGKRSGGCCGNLTSRTYNPRTKTFSPATIYIICNSPKNEKDPDHSLLNFNDVETLFHEFGHAFHHLFSTNKYKSLNGTGYVERDAVELPSQLMENFCYDEFVLSKISKHIETKQIIPQSLINNIKLSNNFMSSFTIRKYSAIDKIDNIIYTQRNFNLKEIENQCFEESLYLHKKYNILNTKIIPVLHHIFTSGYQAQLYVYKWAEVYSCDAFHIFSQSGNSILEQKNKILEFKEKIYSKGGKGSLKNHWRDFKGQEVSFEPFLKKHGLLT